MEPNSVPTTFHHHRSLSSDRFLGIFSSSSSPPSTTDSGDDDELNEDEILWTGNFAESNHHSTTSTTTITNNHRSLFLQNSGILAVLPESNHTSVLHRKPLISSSSSSTSSKLIPSIPRPPQDREYNTLPPRKFQQSAPMNVPVLSMAMAIAKQRNCKFSEFDDPVGDDEMLLPPHEIVARGSGMSPKTTFSVLEGVGRTLKGRDLRQVRNAVWRQTGFLD